MPLTGSVVLYPVSNRGDISDVPDTPSYTPPPAVPDTGDSSSDDYDDDDTPAVSNSSNSTTARQPSAGPAALDYAIKRGDTLGAILSALVVIPAICALSASPEPTKEALRQGYFGLTIKSIYQ